MLFASGIGIGLFYFGVAEPIWHYEPCYPPYGAFAGLAGCVPPLSPWHAALTNLRCFLGAANSCLSGQLYIPRDSQNLSPQSGAYIQGHNTQLTVSRCAQKLQRQPVRTPSR